MQHRQSQAALAPPALGAAQQEPDLAFAQEYGNAATMTALGSQDAEGEPGFFEEAFGPESIESPESIEPSESIEPVTPESGFVPKAMGDGKGKKTAVGKKELKSWKTGDTEYGGKMGGGLAYGGVNMGRSKTKYSGKTVETSSSSYKADMHNVGGTRTSVRGSDRPGGTVVRRKEDRESLLKKTRTKTDVTTRRSGKDSTVTGKTDAPGKRGLKLKRRLNAKEKKEHESKSAREEAGVDKQMEKGGLSKALEHVSFGGVGDESGIDLQSFAKQRDNETDYTGASSGSKAIVGGEEASAKAMAGIDASGSVLSESRDVDAFGNERVSRAGATGEGFAGAESTASATHKRTRDGGKEVAAKAAAKVGVGGEGAAGATTQTQLAKGITAEAGAQAKGSGFLGVKGSAESKASHGKIGAKASASGEASAGIEASGSVGAETGIKAGGFNLAGARAKGEANGFAGAKGKASGEVSAHAIKGAKATGSADAFAGAKADGNASVGVSAGGVDLDGVVEGEAKAGALANANGTANVGALGAGVSGGVEAFAGAKAGGEARFELGAGGLNFGAIGVNGEVSAGIGVRANGKASLAIHDVGLTGRAGVTYGVGAAMGAMFSIDPSFPVRLTLDKLAENNVIPTSDIGDLITSAANLVYKPKAPAGATAPPKLAGGAGPADRVGPTDLGAAPGLGEVAGLGQVDTLPMVEEAVGPAPAVDSANVKKEKTADLSKSTTFDSLMVDASPDQQAALTHTQGVVAKQLESTGPAVMAQMEGIVSDGGSLYADFMALLGNAFQASQDAQASAKEGIAVLVATGEEEAAGVADQAHSFGEEMMAEISALVASDPGQLLDGGWEQVIDDAVGRVTSFCLAAQAQIAAIIERIRAAVAAIAKAALDAAIAPVRALTGMAASVVGYFTAKVASAGQGMIDGMRAGLGPAEKGIRVPGTEGALALPFPVTPMLDVAEGAVGEMSSFGRDSVAEGINGAIDFIANALGDVIGLESGGAIGGMADLLTGASSMAFGTIIMLATGTAEFAKPMIRAAVWIYEQIKAAADAASAWFMNLFGGA